MRARRPATAGGSGAGVTPWGTTWLLLAFMLVNFADKTVLGLAAQPVMADLGLTRGEFGTASAAFFALFSLAALGGAALTRRVRTPVLLLGMALLWSAAQLPMVLAAAGFGTLLVTRVLLGAAEGPAAPVAMHHLHGWFRQRDRQLPTSILLFGASAGVAVASPTLGLVISHWGWRAAFGTVGAVGLLWAALWLRYGRSGPYAPEPGRARPPAQPTEPPPAAHPAPTDPAEPTDQPAPADRVQLAAPVRSDGTAGTGHLAAGQPWVPYRRILLSGTWLAAACGALAAYWTVSAGLTWSADYFQQVSGVSLNQASLLMMLGALAKGLAMVVHGLAAQHSASRAARGLPRRGSPLPTGVNNALLMLGSALGMAGFAVTDALWVKVVLLLGPMALVDVILPVATTAVSRITPAPQRGVTLGALTGVFALGGTLAPLVLGRVVDAGATATAGYLHAYLLMAALVGAAGLVVAVFLRPERDARLLGVPPDSPVPGPEPEGPEDTARTDRSGTPPR